MRFFSTPHFTELFKYTLIVGDTFVILNGFDDERVIIIWMDGRRDLNIEQGHATVFAHDDSDAETSSHIVHLR